MIFLIYHFIVVRRLVFSVVRVPQWKVFVENRAGYKPAPTII
jgi:hypothetical protein